MMLYDGGMGHYRGVAPVAARHKVEALQRERESQEVMMGRAVSREKKGREGMP